MISCAFDAVEEEFCQKRFVLSPPEIEVPRRPCNELNAFAVFLLLPRHITPLFVSSVLGSFCEPLYQLRHQKARISWSQF